METTFEEDMKARPKESDIKSFLAWLNGRTPPEVLMMFFATHKTLNAADKIIDLSKELINWEAIQRTGVASPASKALWEAIAQYEFAIAPEVKILQ